MYRGPGIIVIVVLSIIGLILFVPGLGNVHLFDWDEINFAESAREMILTKDFFNVQINFQKFWEKPPLFFWLQSLSYSLFGINDFAARFPNAIIGVFSLISIFSIGSKHFDARFGSIWVLSFLGSFLPHFYFKSGIIDPTFNLFKFLGVYKLALASFQFNNQTKTAIQAGIYIGLAILTKGPVALLIAGLCYVAFFAISLSLEKFKIKELFFFGLAILIVSSAWYAVELANSGIWFFQEFITYQIRLFKTGDAGHGQPFYYHPIVLLIGCFPASILFILSLRKNYSDSKEQVHLKKWMNILFWVVLVLFSIVKTKIVHYSSLCYLPLTFIAAHYIYRFPENKHPGWKYTVPTLIIALILGLAITAIPYIGSNPDLATPYIKDPFAVASFDANIQWSLLDFSIGALFTLFVIIILLMTKRIGFHNSVISIYVACLVLLQVAMLSIVPKVEKYTQNANIEFYEALQQEDCYIHVMGFKSYGKYFYSRSQPQLNPNASDEEWLLNGDIDKPAYFVLKSFKKDLYPELTNCTFLYNKNGFSFYKRDKILF